MKAKIMAIILFSTLPLLASEEGESCKINLRPYAHLLPPEIELTDGDAVDSFPEIEYCSLREVLRFEEEYLGQTRVAYLGAVWKATRPIYVKVLEGVVTGGGVGFIQGCPTGVTMAFFIEENDEEWFNNIDFDTLDDTNKVTGLFSSISSLLIGPVIKFDPQEEIIQRKAVRRTGMLSKGATSAVSGYFSSQLFSFICQGVLHVGSHAFDLEVDGIINLDSLPTLVPRR